MRFICFLLFVCSINLYGQSRHINVMTYNIRYPNTSDGIHYWDHRRPLVVSTIRYHEVDLLGVQEAHGRQLDEIITDLPQYEWIGVCRTDGTINPNPDNEFSAILYRKDRFERLDGSTFWLSDTPDKVASVGWDAALPRIVTWVKFKDRKTKKIFFHFNTHFDHVGKKARNESAKLLLEKIKAIAGKSPVVITGDFNCDDKDDPYEILTKESERDKLTDALKISRKVHHGPMKTFAGNFMSTGLEDRRIDYIFIKNNAAVLKHAILAESWDGKLASDHLPVFATLLIK